MSGAVHRRLCSALMEKVGPATILDSRDRPWASVTFSGARHWIRLSVAEGRAAELTAQLPEAEFSIAGQLVADLAITGQRVAGPLVELDIEALTVACDDGAA